MKILIFTDNKFMYKNFKKIIEIKKLDESNVLTYACSPLNKIFENYSDIRQIRIKDNVTDLLENFDLIISCHSKQIFPKELVNSMRCINIHPGLNPFNRGWYPQVFSIINGMPLGATIHEMDEEIDHGNIILQKEVEVHSWDTSLSAYNRVLETEVVLLQESIEQIISNTYNSYSMSKDGNYNSRDTFNKLCELDLSEEMTLGKAIDRLRALTHGEFKNAYFFDSEGNKLYLNVNIDKC